MAVLVDVIVAIALLSVTAALIGITVKLGGRFGPLGIGLIILSALFGLQRLGMAGIIDPPQGTVGATILTVVGVVGLLTGGGIVAFSAFAVGGWVGAGVAIAIIFAAFSQGNFVSTLASILIWGGTVVVFLLMVFSGPPEPTYREKVLARLDQIEENTRR